MEEWLTPQLWRTVSLFPTLLCLDNLFPHHPPPPLTTPTPAILGSFSPTPPPRKAFVEASSARNARLAQAESLPHLLVPLQPRTWRRSWQGHGVAEGGEGRQRWGSLLLSLPEEDSLSTRTRFIDIYSITHYSSPFHLNKLALFNFLISHLRWKLKELHVILYVHVCIYFHVLITAYKVAYCAYTEEYLRVTHY